MEHPADNTQLLNVALDHARSVAQTLGAQRDNLQLMAPGEQEAAAKVARAQEAAAEVGRALKASLRRRTGSENQS